MNQDTAESTRVDAFAAFMHAHQDMVFSTAVRLLGNAAQAEDISQDVFLKAYERFDELQASPTAAGWLRTVTTNLTLNHLSRYRRRWRFFSDLHRERDAEGEAEIDFPVPDTLMDDVDEGERAQRVEAALRGLPAHLRVPLVLYHFEEMAYDAIATHLGISLAKVKIDIHRARAKLAQVLLRQGIAP